MKKINEKDANSVSIFTSKIFFCSIQIRNVASQVYKQKH